MFAKCLYICFFSHFSILQRCSLAPKFGQILVFVVVEFQQGLLDVCKISQMFLVLQMCLQCLRKCSNGFRNLFLRSWVADFYRYFNSIVAKIFAKMLYNFATVQKCLQICKIVKKKKCLWGVKIIIIFIQQDSRKIYFVLYSHPLLAISNRERRLALYCGQY